MPFGELRAGILAGVVGFAVACGGSVIGPENQMEVAELTDRFQFQATATPVPTSATRAWPKPAHSRPRPAPPGPGPSASRSPP